MTDIIMFCPECKIIIAEDYDKHCKVSKDGMHWYQAFYVDQIPEEFAWLKEHIQPVQTRLF